MSGTTAPEQEAGAGPSPQAGSGHRSGRRRWVAAGVVVVAVAAGVVAAGIAGTFGGPGRPGAGTAANAYRSSTAMVTRRSLASQTQVAATLGDAGAYTVVNQAQGTITALPAAGQVVRQGHVLYRVSGSPVILLYGKVPAYRSLSEGMTGPDVAELNADLVTLGYATSAELGPGSDYFSLGTAYALETLESRLGVTQTGALTMGQAVFLPTAARITALGAATVLGGAASPGAAVLSASSTTPVVTIDLDAAQQGEVKAGDKVTITLPSGKATPGVVSSVSTVATTPSSGSSGGSSSSSSGGSGSTPTITVEVTPAHPKAARGLDQAPVEVTITTGRVRSALVVPVDALLARAGGGYAVEVTGAGRIHHLVAVSPGLFDDAAGLVQVSGAGLAAGQYVVVPAT
jgi:hypothetical protein